MLRRLRRFLALRGDDRRIFLRAFVWLAAVDVALRALGFSRLMRRAELTRPVDVGSVPALPSLRRARAYARRIETVSRHHLVRTHCLHRSLVLHFWLRREGVPSALRIGVRKHEGIFKAHAWVELGGVVVNDRAAEVAAFTPLASPAAGRLHPAWS